MMPEGEYPGLTNSEGLALRCAGVIAAGLRPGVIAPRPKPPSKPPITSPPIVSIASSSFSLSSMSAKDPVPRGHCCPSRMFSETPFSGSYSEKRAARKRMSTVSSNED
jgi:hypothetical protein